MGAGAKHTVSNLVGDLDNLLQLALDIPARLAHRSADVGDDLDRALEQFVLEPLAIELLKDLRRGSVGRQRACLVNDLDLDLDTQSRSLRAMEDKIHEGTLAAAARGWI
jgi:hypothetical protein